MTDARDLDVVQHEAAHVVVGVALGLRLRKAVVGRADKMLGYAWFTEHGSALAHAIMYAAGVAWEREHGRESPVDYKCMLEELAIEDERNVPGAAAAETRTALRVASLLLRNLGDVHKRVTLALLQRDLNSRDIAAIARGERLSDE